MENRKRKGKQLTGTEHVKQEPQELTMLPDQSDSSCLNSVKISSTATSSILESILPNLAGPATKGKCIKTPPALDSQNMTKDPAVYRMISPEEHILYGDLGVAYSTTLGEFISDRKSSENNYKNCNDLINNSEFVVRKLIKFIKQLEDFQHLQQEDQVGLLKTCVLSYAHVASITLNEIPGGQPRGKFPLPYWQVQLDTTSCTNFIQSSVVKWRIYLKTTTRCFL